MKNSIDSIGNRTRVLPACSAVPQPTALPRALSSVVKSMTNLRQMIGGESRMHEVDKIHTFRVIYMKILNVRIHFGISSKLV